MFNVVPATQKHIPAIYEALLGQAKAHGLQFETTKQGLQESLFSNNLSGLKCIVALKGDLVCGVALYYYLFSVFKGRQRVFFDQLYVMDDYRRQGIAESLLSYVMTEAKSKNCSHMLCMLDKENQKVISLYEKTGGVVEDRWTFCRWPFE